MYLHLSRGGVLLFVCLFVCLFVVFPKNHASCGRKTVCIVLRRMVSLVFVPFVWEMACPRCVDFIGLVVLEVRCCRVCDSGVVCADSTVCWFVLCSVVVAYAVEHAGAVTWLWCLLALVVIASSFRA